MSISAIIAALEAAGKLTRQAPKTRQPPKRRLYLTSSALRDFNDPTSAVNVLCGRGFINAALTRWTSGGRIFGDETRGRFLVRLSAPPPEIWEVRVTEPVVQARLFGRFAEPDTLILTKFHTRQLLGRKGSPGWTAAVQHCEQTWANLFETFPPHSGLTIHDYVSENCDDFPI